MGLRLSLAACLYAACTAALKDIPSLGLGTWLSDRDKVPHAVEFGLQNGYHHIDAAWIYRNEDQTGKGIAAAGLAREDVWVTSKLWNTHHRAEEAQRAVRETLAHLGVDQLDLYLIHWPVAFVPGTTAELDRATTLLDTWRAVEGLVRANLTRRAGLSNFARRDVEAVLAACDDVCPYAHEFETHPYLQQRDFVDWHRAAGLRVIAYSPFGNTNPVYRRGEDRGRRLGPLLEDPFWTDLARAKNATPAQAVLAWGIQRGTTVIPKSTSEEHLLENLAAREITFTEDEMEAIAAQDKKARFNNPSKSWGVKLFADLDDHVDWEEETEEEL